MFLTSNNVVAMLRDEYSQWVELLDKKEVIAIRKYSYNSYDVKPNRFFERLNKMLRGEYYKDDLVLLKKYADIISGALKKHPTEHSFMCYRKLDTDPTKGIDDGKIFTFDQFISTSVIESRTFQGRYEFYIYVHEGVCGAYIEQLSYFPSQREFLLDMDCVYKVVSRKKEKIYLEVLP